MNKFALAQAIIDGEPSEEQISRMAAVIGLTDENAACDENDGLRRFTELVDGLDERGREDFLRMLSTFVR